MNVLGLMTRGYLGTAAKPAAGSTPSIVSATTQKPYIVKAGTQPIPPSIIDRYRSNPGRP